jgi:hypothetical protein
MGVNNPNVTLGQIQQLQKGALTPYSGSAPGGGAAQGVSQLAQALLARQAMQQYQQRLGIPTYGNPAAQPGAVTAPPLAAGGPAVAGAVPQLQGQPALNPQAIPSQ